MTETIDWEDQAGEWCGRVQDEVRGDDGGKRPGKVIHNGFACEKITQWFCMRKNCSKFKDELKLAFLLFLMQIDFSIGSEIFYLNCRTVYCVLMGKITLDWLGLANLEITYLLHMCK